jgi:hypothetical protein
MKISNIIRCVYVDQISWNRYPMLYDATNNNIHTPLIIAVYSAHLDIMANRQIITRV